MKIKDLRLHELQPGEAIPFRLLLLADEDDAIRKYIYNSSVYTLYYKPQKDPIGVVAISRANESEIEIKNIGVLESFRNNGLGSLLINYVKEIAYKENYTDIIVGTADNGINQSRFYERNGFVKYAVKKNYFIDNYSRPIVDDGVLLKDMVMLKMKL
ncbi:MAG TPA: GNAT family N-acetyltransferase [Chitinophagaceae bacterium]|jgi:ribosomal protein S18 acetylase RimI-like enzyme|nr:GNAT family N-acetyltransferase [Chitinophagaceae bacterium]